jgi:predicted RNase H-like HicB family nuclease
MRACTGNSLERMIEDALANLKEALKGFLETADAEEAQARLKKPALFTCIEVECV